MNILDQIIQDKRKEVELKKQIIPIQQLESSELFSRSTISLKNRMNKTSGIIAEFKRRSPSKSTINQEANVWDVAKFYENSGAAAMSILTDGKYFGGSLDDLILGRSAVSIPLLRKEFIVDAYQILEAKAYGSDLILLIASVLKREEIKQFSEFAHSLGLEVLLEIHNQEELEKSIMPSLDFIGINNRNLKTFETQISTSLNLVEFIPNDFLKISESGIQDAETIEVLRSAGFDGFLIGESLMKNPHLNLFQETNPRNFSNI